MRPGEYGKDRAPVTGHPLDIPQRLREINGDYFVVWNRRTRKYEIHCDHSWGDTLECVLPYDELDGRAVAYAREHDIRRREEIIREMEEHNRRLEEAALRDYMERAADRTREAIRYVRARTDREEIPPELTETGKGAGA